MGEGCSVGSAGCAGSISPQAGQRPPRAGWVGGTRLSFLVSGFRITDGRDFPGGPVVKTSLSNAGGVGSIPGRGAGMPHASRPKDRNIEQKQYCNKFNKDFKNGPRQKKKKKRITDGSHNS